jgi:beta-mannosidase
LPSEDTGELTSSDMKNHQKHSIGYETILKYMIQDYKIPHDLENFSYVSQLLQAEGMKTAMEAHRRAKPYCMGTLYWQLNDCWPVTSWSSIDYYNIWKASQYQAKRSYQEVIISVEEKENNCFVYVVSDLLKSSKAELTVELFDLKGKLLWSDHKPIQLDSNSSKVYYDFDKTLIKQYDKNSIVLKCSLISSGDYISDMSNMYYFVKPKDLELVKPRFIISENSCENVQCFKITSDVLMKDVCISIDGEMINLSDNYFDLLPGVGKTIYLPAGKKINHLGKKIRIRSLVDTY